jgi:hypothetical protein
MLRVFVSYAPPSNSLLPALHSDDFLSFFELEELVQVGRHLERRVQHHQLQVLLVQLPRPVQRLGLEVQLTMMMTMMMM